MVESKPVITMQKKIKVLFFIDGFLTGGKERRLLELLRILHDIIDYKVAVIHSNFEYDIPINIKERIIQLKKSSKKDIKPFFDFYRICKDFNPDIIHTWANMVTFYSLPAKILLKKRLINSQITDAPPFLGKFSFYDITIKINLFFSDLILSNSFAGLEAYKAPSNKSKVIYNGVNLDRFSRLENKELVRRRFGINTKYAVIMVASFSEHKDYDLFINVAEAFATKTEDVSFLAVGDGTNFERIKQKAVNKQIQNIIFTGKLDNVESLINTADIGLLFSPNGEGISNSIIEYMALGKPVVANDKGGNKEIVKNEVNGFLVTNNSVDEIVSLVIGLLKNAEMMKKMGEEGKKLINTKFTVERMGEEFLEIYRGMIT